MFLALVVLSAASWYPTSPVLEKTDGSRPTVILSMVCHAVPVGNIGPEGVDWKGFIQESVKISSQ